LFKLAMRILKLVFAEVGETAIHLVQQAELRADWSGIQKAEYVWAELRIKYSRLENYKWLANFIVEWAVGQAVNGTKVVL
jgi:hypothetical protein